MEFLTDRQRVERALVPGMLLASVNALAEHPQQTPEGLAEVVAALQRAVAEPGEGLDHIRRRKLAIRCRALTSRAFEAAEFWQTDTRPDAATGKIYLAVAVWLKELFDRDIMAAGECDFVRAYEVMAAAMAEHWDVLEGMERSAVKAAARLRDFFESEGYFLPAPCEVAA
jgi:hypothetical protein